MSILGPAPAEVFEAANNASGIIDGLINKYILRTKSVQGIGGFVFDDLGEESLTMESDITDHYTENNDAVQDHVARKPLRVTLRGFVAELSQPRAQGVFGLLNSLQTGLGSIPAYIGDYTPGMVQKMQQAITQAQNTLNQVNLAMKKVQNVLKFLPGSTAPVTVQEKAFLQLLTLWAKNEPVSVDTPFSVLRNMVIERVSMMQPEETTSWSEITVSLKQIRFVEVETVPNDGSFAGRQIEQQQSAVNKGVVPGAAVNQSIGVSLMKSAGWLN